MTRDELIAAAIRVCTEAAQSGGVVSATLDDARAVVADLVQQALAGGVLNDRDERKREKARLRQQRARDGKRDSSVTERDSSRLNHAPPRDGKRDSSVTGSVTGSVTERDSRAFSDLPPSQDLDLTEEDQKEEGESDTREATSAASRSQRDSSVTVARETLEPWTDRDQRDLDALDPPDADLGPPLHALVWDAWLASVHGGKDAGHYPRAHVFACCEVLRARGLGVDAFRAAIETWCERKRKRGGGYRFGWFVEDLAEILDTPQRAGRTQPASREVFLAEHERYLASLTPEQRAARVEPDQGAAF